MAPGDSKYRLVSRTWLYLKQTVQRCNWTEWRIFQPRDRYGCDISPRLDLVLDHLISKVSPSLVDRTSPLANCLVGSKDPTVCGSKLVSLRKEKYA